MESEPRLYVIVRKDLPDGAKTAQAVHAAAALVSEQGLVFSGIPYVIVYKASPTHLEQWRERLWPAHGFEEPDMGNMLTAVAYWGPKVSGFEKLQLL